MDIQQEIMERDKRRSVIILGAEESKESVVEKKTEHDSSLVQNTGREMEVVDLKAEKILRTGAAGRKPRPMKTVLEGHSQRDYILRAAKNLETK